MITMLRSRLPTAFRRPLALPTWIYAAQLKRWPWLVAVVGVCAVGVFFAQQQHLHGALPVLLTCAPVLPVLCVAGSYAGRADPFVEVSRTTPAGNLRLLLIRTGQVLLLCMPLLTAVAAFLPSGKGTVPGPAAWLLPCLTLTLLTLVGGSYIGCWPAALGTLIGWMVLVASAANQLAETPRPPLPRLLSDVLSELIDSSQQMWWALAGAFLTYLLTQRRHSFNRTGARR